VGSPVHLGRTKLKGITTYAKGRLNTFLFSIFSAAAFFSGALLTIYVTITGQDRIIGELLMGDLRGTSYLTVLLGQFLLAGVFSFILALLCDFTRQVQLYRKEQRSTEALICFLSRKCFPAAEQDNIIGDLLEEVSRFESNTKAYFWILGQVRSSLCSLVIRFVNRLLF
jgi:hypothetical protein